jgi:hemolysin activation/secretion protein
MFTIHRRLLSPVSGRLNDRFLLAFIAAIVGASPCAEAAPQPVAELPEGSAPSEPAIEAAFPDSESLSPSRAKTSLFIREYRVQGAKRLSKLEVEAAVYPYIGPARTEQDVEQARSALEKAYKEKGFQAAAVQVPVQQARNGVVILRVTEGIVGRLRVTGSRYFSLSKIKQNAPSLAEGKVVDFNAITKDIVGLNQLPDRQVTPALRAGSEPGTVDID